MTNINFPELKEKFEIQAYRNIKNLDRSIHTPFPVLLKSIPMIKPGSSWWQTRLLTIPFIMNSGLKTLPVPKNSPVSLI